MSGAALPRRLRAALALSALNYRFGAFEPERWRIFATSTGRLQAVTTTAQRRDYNGVLWTGLPDAVDADSPRELALKLSARMNVGASRQGAGAAQGKDKP